jgi:hypothetical protein
MLGIDPHPQTLTNMSCPDDLAFEGPLEVLALLVLLSTKAQKLMHARKRSPTRRAPTNLAAGANSGRAEGEGEGGEECLGACGWVGVGVGVDVGVGVGVGVHTYVYYRGAGLHICISVSIYNMYVYMYVCIHIYIHVCTYVCVCECVYVCVCVYA